MRKGLLCFAAAALSVLSGCNDAKDADAGDAALDGGSTDGAVDDTDGSPGDGGVGPEGCAPDTLACPADVCGAATCLSIRHLPPAVASLVGADAGLAAFTLDGGRFDTDNGAIVDGLDASVRGANEGGAYAVREGVGYVLVPQAAGEPPVGVWIMRSASLGGHVRFVGDAGAHVLAVDGFTLAANGHLDVSADRARPGPGGFRGGDYGTPGQGCAPGIVHDAGATVYAGSGGGFGSDGGRAGSNTAAARVPGGAAGSCAAYADLDALRGGSGGAGGDDSDSTATKLGGAGGGALQLSSTGTVAVGGLLNAGGGGGRTAVGNGRDGAGGGSGGAILIEAPKIAFAGDAGVFANGGGGGSASSGTGTPCAGSPVDGANGGPGLVPAIGGQCGVAKGGSGAAGATNADAGDDGSGGGGGGGGHGRVVFRTIPTQVPNLATVPLSPPADHAAVRSLTNLAK